MLKLSVAKDVTFLASFSQIQNEGQNSLMSLPELISHSGAARLGSTWGVSFWQLGTRPQALRFPEVQIFLVLRPNSDDFSLGGGPQG